MKRSKVNETMKKGLALLLSGYLVFGQFAVNDAHAADPQTPSTYDTVVTKAGNYAMKQVGESIRSNAVNAQVVTSAPGSTQGTIYYIDQNGNDTNNGTSAATPWKTVQKVNATTFQPGDQILFKSGSTWELTEALYPKGSGTEGNRIVIGAYGSGAKPKFTAKNIGVPWTFTDGTTRYASDALYLENQEFIEIRDLDISNKPDGYTGQESTTQAELRKDRRGIHIVGGNNTTQTELNGFWLHDLYVHDIVGEANGVSATGWDPSKRTAGILFEIIVKGSNGLPVIANPVDVTGYQPTWFADVTIENNVLIDNSFGGIIVKQLQAWGARQDEGSAPSYDYNGWYPNKRFTIQDNYLDHDGSEYAADTIYLTCTNDSIITHNVSRGAGTSAIELYFTDRITVEWNEVFRARQKPTGADSNGIDPDKASTNALIQYNYLHENGDGILLCGFIYGSAVVRYNVIKDSNSSKRYLNIHGDKGYNYIYNNIFYNSGTSTPTFVSSSGGGTFLNDSNNFHYLSNNIFYSPNSTGARVEDGTGLFYSNNSYNNVAVVPTEDTSAIVANPKFVNPTGITGGAGSDVDLSGLKLQADSPLISRGKTITSHPYMTLPVGSIMDVAGNPISTGGTDLGIYEFVGSNATVGELRGYTYDPYGDLKAGVAITAQSGGQTYTATSDANGYYSISSIADGSQMTVTVSFPNYVNSAPATAQIHGADVVALNLTLGASTLTTGTIAGSTGGISGATITLKDSVGQVVGTKTTASDGSYSFSDVPVGNGYTVTAQKENFYDAVQSAVTVQAAHTTVVNMILTRVVRQLHYFLVDNFNYPAGSFASNSVWNVDNTGGPIDIVKDDNGNSYLKLAKTANAGAIRLWNKTAMNATGVFTIESRIKRTVAGGTSNQFAVYTGESNDSTGNISAPMADFGMSQGNIFTHATRGSGTTSTVAKYNLNQWYNIKMVVNMDTDTFDLYLDGVKKQTGAQLRTAGNAVNYFQIFASANNTGDLLVDYFWVYEGSPEGDNADVTGVTVDELGGSALTYDSAAQTFTSTVQVPYQNDTVKIRVTPSSPFAEVVLNGTNLGRIEDNDYVAVPVSSGENNVSFTVTAADGTAKTYTVKLNKQDRSLLSYLTSLDISGVTLSPSFVAAQPEESEVTYSAGTTTEFAHTLSFTTATSGSTVSITHNGQTLSGISPVPLTLKEGANTITMVVSSESGDMFTTYTITVNAPVQSISVTDVSVTPSTLTLTAGGTSQLTAAVMPVNATNKAVSWSSSNTAVAEVNASGLVTAKQAGTAVITVTTADGLFTKASQLTVVSEPTVTTTTYYLNGPGSVTTDETFHLIYGMSNITGSVYAKSVTVNYDPAAMAYVKVNSLVNGFGVIGSLTSPGKIKIIEASTGTSSPVTGDLDLLSLEFRALNTSITTNVYLSDIVLGDQNGNEVAVTSGTGHGITIAAPVQVDKANLLAGIQEAQAIITNAPIAPRYGSYSEREINTINAVIDAAKDVLNQSTATQVQVDQATSQLAQALLVLKATANQTVGIGDIAIVAAHFDATNSDPGWSKLRVYDFNNDGKIDLYDLVTIAQQFLN